MKDIKIKDLLKGLQTINQSPEFWAKYRSELAGKINQSTPSPALPQIPSSWQIHLAIMKTAALFLLGLGIGYLVAPFIHLQPTPPPQPQDEKIATATIENKILGLKLLPVSKALQAHLNIPMPNALVISDIMENSIAQKSGLQSGDILIEINGQPIKDYHRLEANDHLELRIIRKGITITVDITK